MASFLKIISQKKVLRNFSRFFRFPENVMIEYDDLGIDIRNMREPLLEELVREDGYCKIMITT